MKRFYGKYRFIIDNRKLVFWESRLGLIGKDRTTIRDRKGNMVPLPPECCMFLAISLGDGTCHLQACNGEVVSCNMSPSLGLATTYPTQMSFYPAPTTPMRFSIEELRRSVGGRSKLRYFIESDPEKTFHDLGYMSGRAREVDDISAARYITNLANGSQAGTDWTLDQLGDGLDQMTSAPRKVAHFDFTPAGKAVVDVSGEDLSGVDFGRSDFSRAVLAGANLSSSRHAGSQFNEADLDRVNFSGATLDNVAFNDARMNATNLSRVTGASCDFSDCDLRSVIVDAPLALASPENAPLRFSYAKFKYSLIGANWLRKIMDWAQISDIPNGEKLDATKADLTGVELGGVRFAAQCKFDNAILRNASLVECSLPFASFKGASLDGSIAPDYTGADLAAARLQGCDFSDARCARANFSGARLDEAKFAKAQLQKANFANAYLRRVNFAAVEQRGMTGASFNRAFLVGCDFSGADLSTYQTDTVNLTQAYLHGADFTNANLAGTLMAGAGIAFGDGELDVTIDGDRNPVDYDATTIDAGATTTRETTCPLGNKGPCTETQMHTRTPFPTVWPWPLGRAAERDDDATAVDTAVDAG
ncbi:pentapeptide repeat-containing protein [Tahibacter caeni]|uniref:pentapeptide repeat-containing protein n=1 Tax=Tahibacter caeni TaxID=1453545 RepID=UPI0021485CF1|nr:pentapeptide repeat-containing protein [Tahibacter caeni]